MNVFTQFVLTVGRISPDGVQMLGSGFLLSSDGKIGTTSHIINNNDSRLVVLLPHINNINNYQDISNNTCKKIDVEVLEIDPLRDLCILKAKKQVYASMFQLGSFDEVNVGDKLHVFGFPHCVDGRRVFTFQESELGAKILLESSGIKSKSGIINMQARPGQSGSMVYHPKTQKISGILIGAYAPSGGISLGGIDPRELHQTTHCVSAEYFKDML